MTNAASANAGGPVYVTDTNEMARPSATSNTCTYFLDRNRRVASITQAALPRDMQAYQESCGRSQQQAREQAARDSNARIEALQNLHPGVGIKPLRFIEEARRVTSKFVP